MTTVAGVSASNARNVSVENNKRGATIARVCGLEYSATAVGGTAVCYIPHDNDMCFVSDYKFKLVLGTGDEGIYDPFAPPAYSAIIHDNAHWKTLREFQETYPIGTWIDVDGKWGAQCYDYANAFWYGQVNRGVVSNDNAKGIWNLKTQNAGSEFDLIGTWANLRPGDVIIWGGNGVGHVAMAMTYPSGNNIIVWGQNQGAGHNYVTGLPVSKRNADSSNFLGAFRYKGWDVGDVTGENNLENGGSYHPIA